MSSLRSVLERSLYCLDNNISFCLDRCLIVTSNLQHIYTLSLISSVRYSLPTIFNHNENVVVLPMAVKKCRFFISKMSMMTEFLSFSSVWRLSCKSYSGKKACLNFTS